MTLTTLIIYPKNSFLKRGYLPRLEPFSGNYILSTPEIKVFPKDEQVKGLMLATDGLWDELNIKDVIQLYNRLTEKNPQNFVRSLFQEALDRAANFSGMSFDDLHALKTGERRTFHDDISLVYIDFTH